MARLGNLYDKMFESNDCKFDMTSFIRKPSFSACVFPVCICKNCGLITRVFMYGENDRHFCRSCGGICTVTKYSLSDDEVEHLRLNKEKAKVFREELYKEYLKE